LADHQLAEIAILRDEGTVIVFRLIQDVVI